MKVDWAPLWANAWQSFEQCLQSAVCYRSENQFNYSRQLNLRRINSDTSVFFIPQMAEAVNRRQATAVSWLHFPLASWTNVALISCQTIF